MNLPGRRPLRLAAALLALVAVAGPGAGANAAQATTKYDGSVSVGNFPFTIVSGPGKLGVTVQAFLSACRLDKVAGQRTPAIDAVIHSPINGVDAFIVDLGKERFGAFAVKGPGAKPFGPEIQGMQFTDYDLDLDFFTDPDADPTVVKGTGCLDANEKGVDGNRCYARKATPDEKTPCISGYRASNGKLHGARYVVVNASANFRGPMAFTLTTS